MKEFVFNRKDYKIYEDFYGQIYDEMEGAKIPDWEDYPNLDFSADNLYEFLWYHHNDGNKYTFKNFDLERIRNYKNFDDYEFNKIIDVFEDFVKEYPNNTLEFVNDD